MTKFKNLKISLVLIFIGLFWSVSAISNENKSLSLESIKNIEGVYKRQFPNGLVDGTKYQSEDIIEIVSYSSDAIYFRVKLDFYNGHHCGIYGIAKFNKDSFIYKNNYGLTPEESCTLTISYDKKELKITDTIDENSPSTCSYYCGARGSLDNYKINMEKKRKIKYMPIILKSREYQEAVDEYKKINGIE